MISRLPNRVVFVHSELGLGYWNDVLIFLWQDGGEYGNNENKIMWDEIRECGKHVKTGRL